MKQLKKTLITLRILTGLFIPLGVSAAEVPAEVQNPDKYDFQADPYLLEWTFGVKAEELVVEPSPEDRVLERWKTKQAHLWKNLESGKKFVINASAYTAAADECGKSDGITASGLKVAEERTLACPPNFPFGTKIAISGMGVYRCEDRGGAIKGNHIDIYMETKGEAFAFGRRNLEAEIVD